MLFCARKLGENPSKASAGSFTFITRLQCFENFPGHANHSWDRLSPLNGVPLGVGLGELELLLPPMPTVPTDRRPPRRACPRIPIC